MTIWLIANPKAGCGDRGESFWRSYLETSGLTNLTPCDLENDSWIERIQPGDWLLAAGGDGTVSRAAEICVSKEAVLGVLPSGTANDFARNLGLPPDPQALCDLIASGSQQSVDVGWVNEQLFLNVSHIGVGTWPVRGATSEVKQRWGQLGYARVLVSRLWAYRGFPATIRCDGQMAQGRWLSIAIASGAFYGGGNPIPRAAANDGQLDVVAVRPRSFVHLFLVYTLVRIFGREARKNATIVHFKGGHCEVATRRPKTVTADGEIVSSTPLKARCEAGRLQVLCESVVST